jgi:hypothetical protein
MVILRRPVFRLGSVPLERCVCRIKVGLRLGGWLSRCPTETRPPEGLG